MGARPLRVLVHMHASVNAFVYARACSRLCVCVRACVYAHARISALTSLFLFFPITAYHVSPLCILTAKKAENVKGLFR